LASIAFASACKEQPQASSVKIFGGTETSDYPAVLRMLIDKTRGRFCTGIAVSESTVLMAGHCIKNETLAADGGIYVDLKANLKPGITAEQMNAAKKNVAMWNAVGNLELLTDQAAARDLAVVWFENAPFQSHVKISADALAGRSAAARTPVTLVGFGATEFGASIGALNSGGTKRAGSNTIAAVNEGLYIIKADLRSERPHADNAAQAAGDAGGPLFDDKGELIAVGTGVRLLKADGSSTGTVAGPWKYLLPNPTDAAYAENAFVSLASPEALDLLRYAVRRGAKIDGLQGDVSPDFRPEDEIWAAPNGADKRGSWHAMCGGGVIDPQARPREAAALQDPFMNDPFFSGMGTMPGGYAMASSDPFYSSQYSSMFAVSPPPAAAYMPAPSPYTPFAPAPTGWDESFFGEPFPWGTPTSAPGGGSSPSASWPGSSGVSPSNSWPGSSGVGPSNSWPGSSGVGGMPPGGLLPQGPFAGGGVTCSATASGPNASATAIATSGPGGTTCQKSN
jgi:hypothetical protein